MSLSQTFLQCDGDFRDAYDKSSALESPGGFKHGRSQRSLAAPRVQFSDAPEGDSTNKLTAGVVLPTVFSAHPPLQPLARTEPAPSAAPPDARCLHVRAQSQGSTCMRRSRQFRSEMSGEPDLQEATGHGPALWDAEDTAAESRPPVVRSAFMFPSEPRERCSGCSGGSAFDADADADDSSPAFARSTFARRHSSQPFPPSPTRYAGLSALQPQLSGGPRGPWLRAPGCSSGEYCREHGGPDPWTSLELSSPTGVSQQAARARSSAAAVWRTDGVRVVAVHSDRRGLGGPPLSGGFADGGGSGSPNACGAPGLGFSDSSATLRSSSSGEMDVTVETLETPRRGAAAINASLSPSAGVLSRPVVLMAKIVPARSPVDADTVGSHGSPKSPHLGRRRSEHGSTRRGRRQQERRRVACWADADVEGVEDGSGSGCEGSSDGSSETDSDIGELVQIAALLSRPTAPPAPPVAGLARTTHRPPAGATAAAAVAREATTRRHPTSAVSSTVVGTPTAGWLVPVHAATTTGMEKTAAAAAKQYSQLRHHPSSKSAKELLFNSLQDDFSWPEMPPQPKPQPQAQTQTPRRTSYIREAGATVEATAQPLCRAHSCSVLMAEAAPLPRIRAGACVTNGAAASGGGAVAAAACEPGVSDGGEGSRPTLFEMATEAAAARRGELRGWSSSRSLRSVADPRRHSLALSSGDWPMVGGEASAAAAAPQSPSAPTVAARALKPASVLSVASGTFGGVGCSERRGSLGFLLNMPVGVGIGGSDGEEEAGVGGREGARSRASTGPASAPQRAADRPRPPRRLPYLHHDIMQAPQSPPASPSGGCLREGPPPPLSHPRASVRCG
jgi:hypothetical protein